MKMKKILLICLPILKSPNPSRVSLVRHSLHKLNRIGGKQHPCLTPLPIFTLLVSPQFSRTLTLWAMYKLPIKLLSLQSIPVPFRICINLVQLTQSNIFYQSMKQTHSSSSISKVHSDEPFYYQLMHIMLKNTELLKHSKIMLQHVSVYIETTFRELKSVLG